MKLLLPCLALCLFATAATATAEPMMLAGNAVTVQDLIGNKANDGMSLDQAVRKVRRETGGRILSAKTVTNKDGDTVHRIKVLTPDNRVVIYEIDR